jgi:hypothetical protein
MRGFLHVDRLAIRILLLSCNCLALTWSHWRVDLGAQGSLALGYEPPPACEDCACACPATTRGGGSEISLSEGNLTDQYHVTRVTSAFGATLELSLRYDSANADGSKMRLDTGLGAGWTHSYNVLFFRQSQQPGNLFRLDPSGRVTTFRPNSDGTFTPNGGYFERLTANVDGS